MSAPDDAQQSAEKILLAPSGASTHVRNSLREAGFAMADEPYDESDGEPGLGLEQSTRWSFPLVGPWFRTKHSSLMSFERSLPSRRCDVTTIMAQNLR